MRRERHLKRLKKNSEKLGINEDITEKMILTENE
jgi:branched-subunit amino acid aminotransferase/4-amino-4-deoxychorismate lyase